MTGLTFEGEKESLTPRQLELVNKVLQKPGFKGTKVQIETLGKAGDNYVANVKKITATLENGETLTMIAKVAPTNEILRATQGTIMLFGNECLMYNEILPKFSDLQQAAGLSKQECFRFPKCYGTLMEPMNEIILLEDLKEDNFEMLDRFTPLTNNSIRIILKNFALLHSLSFAWKKQNPDAFAAYSEKFLNFFELMSANDDFKQFVEKLEEDTISMLDGDLYKKACRGSLSQLSEHFSKVKKYEKNLRFSVVIHGDGWTNNLMFRLEDNVPVEAVLIDYQLSNIGSPACDLMYMIFNCTDYKTRHEHYHDWIDYYHSELDKCLANFDLKANYVYNRDQLDADLRRHSRLYFSTAIILYSMLIRKTEDAAKIKEAMQNGTDAKEMVESMATSNLDPASIALFKSKVEGLIDSYQELGYLG